MAASGYAKETRDFGREGSPTPMGRIPNRVATARQLGPRTHTSNSPSGDRSEGGPGPQILDLGKLLTRNTKILDLGLSL